MRRGQYNRLTSAAVAKAIAAIAAALAFFYSPADAAQPPSDCRAASKIEYDSAKKNFCFAIDLALMSEQAKSGGGIIGIANYKSRQAISAAKQPAPTVANCASALPRKR